jgi:hypothetical protein
VNEFNHKIAMPDRLSGLSVLAMPKMREISSENLHQTLHVTQPACSKFRENYNEPVATPSASRGTGLIAQLAEKECRPEAELRSAGQPGRLPLREHS